jgi:hypothetical protein
MTDAFDGICHRYKLAVLSIAPYAEKFYLAVP